MRSLLITGHFSSYNWTDKTEPIGPGWVYTRMFDPHNRGTLGSRVITLQSTLRPESNTKRYALDLAGMCV